MLQTAPVDTGGTGSFAGSILISLSQQGYAHLFWHQLYGKPFTALTQGSWNDAQPSSSPDGERIAFSSDRAGHWDLYLLNLRTGQTLQLNDDADYDGYPSWSPDGAWLAYERNDSDNLDIFMAPVDGSVPPVDISVNSAADTAPAWRPGAQQIAYVSDRSGHPQLWLVDLEHSDEQRFRELAPAAEAQADPAWSPDGAWLAWTQQEDGAWVIYAQDLSRPDSVPQRLGLGRDPQWNPAGTTVLAQVSDANQTYLTGYTVTSGLALAPEPMPGNLAGITWSSASIADLPGPLASAAAASVNAPQKELASRSQTVALGDVEAPFPLISQDALAQFQALRQRAAQLLGWDPLSSLDNIYLPLDQPLPPDRQQDWLYTGRAFELHNALLDAGWMVVAREQYDGQTYWRVYLKAANQSGGLGQPVAQVTWDFSARMRGSEADAEAGGASASIAPGGYWIDFTALAAEYGFERVPALPDWRTYYPGALFNQFVFRQGLTWEQAMLQLYSPDELATLSTAKTP